MLARFQLSEIARREGIPLHTVERDYVQHLFLRHAARAPLAFKGGTCLRIAYGSARYSEDLDFTAESTQAEALNLIRSAAARLAEYGIAAVVDERPIAHGSIAGRLRYAGPLFDGTDRSRGSVRIDASLRGEAIEVEELFVPRTPYADVPQLVLRSLTRAHLLAEKVGALLTRRQPRDLYDVDFLLRKGASCPRALLDRKMGLYGRHFTLAAFDQGVRASVRTWERELGPLLGQAPPAAAVAGYVRSGVRRMLSWAK